MRNYLLLALIVMLGAFSACKKHHSYPKFGRPDWQIGTSGKYPYSMTVVLQLPDNLRAKMQAGDEFGAFINSECRGVGRVIKMDSSSLYFVQIHGTASEQSKIRFQYYSSNTSYLYQTDYFLDFTVDGNYGTVDQPKTPQLKPVQ